MITTGLTRGKCSVSQDGQVRFIPPSCGWLTWPHFAQKRWLKCQSNSDLARPASAISCGLSIRVAERRSWKSSSSVTSVGFWSEAAKIGASPSRPKKMGPGSCRLRPISSDGWMRLRPPSRLKAGEPLWKHIHRACGLATKAWSSLAERCVSTWSSMPPANGIMKLSVMKDA